MDKRREEGIRDDGGDDEVVVVVVVEERGDGGKRDGGKQGFLSSFGRLVPVRSMRYRMCTSGLSTCWSGTALMGRPSFEVGREQYKRYKKQCATYFMLLSTSARFMTCNAEVNWSRIL
jgi:hypothetical protein